LVISSDKNFFLKGFVMRAMILQQRNSFIRACAKVLGLAALLFAVLPTQGWSFTTNAGYPAAGTLTAGKQVVQVYTSGANTWVYLCYLPYAYDSQPTRKWPVILWQPCMSGTDGGGGGFANMQGGNNCSGISGMMSTPEKYHYISDSFIVVTPWQYWPDFHTCHPASQIDPNYKAYYPPFFSHIFSTARADSDRVHMLGACLGSAFIYKLVTLFPSIPASLTTWESDDPTNGCSDSTKVCLFKNIPMNVIHGDQDTYSPWQHAKSLFDLIVKCGNTKANWYLSAGAPHESWMYGKYNDQDTALYTWMLAQKRTPSTVGVNPANRNSDSKGLTMINLTTGAGISAGDRLEILDLHGQVVSRGSRSVINQASPRLSGGVHLVRITHGNETVLRMAVIK
jgi:hypothetical protein